MPDSLVNRQLLTGGCQTVFAGICCRAMGSSTGLDEAIRVAGGTRKLAKMLNISHQAISKWSQPPAERVLEIERITLVRREKLRPDLYAAPRPRKRSRSDGQAARQRTETVS